MKNFFTTKRICRAGVIAALYVALTCSFGVLSFNGLFQFRPAEALCILPLFYPEAIPALWIGCMLSNLLSQYGVADIFLGSFVTLAAAFLTFLMGKIFSETKHSALNTTLRIGLGGFFPVILNALVVPVIIVYISGLTEGFASAAIAYGWNFFSLLISQSVWIYGLGIPLTLFISRMRKKGVSVFIDKKVSYPQSCG